jgi:hypothetical protein
MQDFQQVKDLWTVARFKELGIRKYMLAQYCLEA